METIKEIIKEIFHNTSLWEVMAFMIAIYLMFKPSLLKRISRLKIGDLELELESIKKEVKEGKEKITELESELEHDRRFLENIMDGFDPSAPVSELASVRQRIKSQANNLSDTESLKNYLKIDASPSEMYVAAVSIREKKPVALLPDIISLLEKIANDKKLGGFRLNTVWTLVSGVHGILIASIRDGITPSLDKKLLDNIENVLKKLEKHPKVQNDRPDNPMKGIRGPIKYSLDWIAKGKEKYKNNA